MHYITRMDILRKLEYEVCGVRYPGDIYLRAYQAADHDPKLRDEIAALEEKYIKRWCDYYTFEERQKGNE